MTTNATSNEHESYVQSTIQDLVERINSLKNFHACQEIDAYCYELSSQVMLTVESAAKHLRRLQEKLLLQIECYRGELISAQGAKQTEKKKRTQMLVKKDLDKLAKEIEAFSSKSAAYFAQHQDSVVDESVVKCGERQAHVFRERAADVKKRLRDLAFNKKFMKFSERKMFYLEDETIGKLEIDDQDESENKIIVLDDLESKAVTLDMGSPINALFFLSNGNLVVCQSDRPLAILDVKTNISLEFRTIPGECEAVAETSDGHLAIGDHRCFIHMLNLNKKKVVKRIDANSVKTPVKAGPGEFWSIVSLRALSNGNLICQYSNAFAIWNPRAQTNNCLVSKFFLDREQISMSPFEVLDDEHVLTGTSKQDVVVFSLLSSKDGRVMRKYELPKESCQKYKFLPNADVMLFGKGGAVIKFNMISRSIQQVASEEEGTLVNISKLSDNRPCLVFQKKAKLVKMPAENGRKAKHASPFSCYAFSKDDKVFATGSNNGSLVIWT